MATAEVLQEAAPVPQTLGRGRVLVADDDPVYRHVLQSYLRGQGYHVQTVADGQRALDVALQPGAPRLMVIDWMMPGMHGPEICSQLRARNSEEQYRYVILLSAKGDSSDVVAGLDAGADDYLIKPFDASELLARLRVGVRILKLQDDLLAAQERMRFQATHDSLTGIWNRGALLQLAQAEIQRAQRNRGAVCLLLIDLDHFKKINDGYGHPAGDIVLHEVAQRLLNTVRVYDVVGRYGGEEFVVVAAGLNLDEPYEYADRLRQVIAAAPIVTPNSEIPVTASVGVALAADAASCDLARLIQCADISLYQAKREGRNRIALNVLQEK